MLTILKYIRKDLIKEFHLDILSKPKLMLDIDDLLIGLTYH